MPGVPSDVVALMFNAIESPNSAEPPRLAQPLHGQLWTHAEPVCAGMTWTLEGSIEFMVDQLLGGLFGSNDDDDDDMRRQRARDFADRAERNPRDLDPNEVMQNYRATTSRLSPEEYQRAAEDAFSRMSPDERRELKREMRRRARMQDQDDRDDDDSPAVLARNAQRAHQEHESGGGLAGLFGFGGGGNQKADNDQGGIGGMLDNPLAKVAIAGIAAAAAKRLTDPNR